jgi:hypothetical protein
LPDRQDVGELGGVVAIYRLLQKSAFEPQDIERMTAAYELALVELTLADRSDPLTETVAQYIFEAAQSGENDPKNICALALGRLRGTDREAC